MVPLTPDSTNNSAKYGVEPVMSSPLLNGATSQREQSIAYREQQSTNQNDMNQKFGGRKKTKKTKKTSTTRKRKYKGGNGIIIPSFNTPGPPVSSGSQSSNGLSTGAASAGVTGIANSACDKCIGPASASDICQGPQCNPNAIPQAGGSGCNGSSGLIQNGQSLGCFSGGSNKMKKRKQSKKKSKKQSKKSKKSKKQSKKSKKSKKSKQSKKSKKSKARQ